VSKPENNAEKNRQDLKNKRNRLYKSFLKNPMHTRSAIEIKVLDDQLAEWTQPNQSNVLRMNVSFK
jgi:hypothetical protein